MKRIRNCNIAGAAFTLIVGTLLHFIHDWFPATLSAVFGAVNESTWEHLKLIFWPMVVFGILEYFMYGRKAEGFLPIKVMSLLIGMLTIVALFYTYTGVLGFNTLALDISTFVIGTLASYLYAYQRLRSPKAWQCTKPAAVTAVIVLAALIAGFIVFTYCPPHIALFADPISGAYGF